MNGLIVNTMVIFSVYKLYIKVR